MDLQEISYDLEKHLSLQYEPAGVSIYKDSDPLLAGFAVDGRELKSYCQAIVQAGEGETLLLQAANMGCKLGTSVLGFEENKDLAMVHKHILAMAKPIAMLNKQHVAA